MNTILIGYSDDRAQTAPQIVAGPEVSSNVQAAIIAKAKQAQEFPAGIARMELCTVTAYDIAIAINPPQPKTKKKN